MSSPPFVKCNRPERILSAPYLELALTIFCGSRTQTSSSDKLFLSSKSSTGKIIGIDKIYKNDKFKQSNFEIRFHLDPDTKIMKTQDGRTIYIDVNNEGWKFSCKNRIINFETGLFFGIKNKFIENQNILISGTINKREQEMIWELQKI